MQTVIGALAVLSIWAEDSGRPRLANAIDALTKRVLKVWDGQRRRAS